ncbi:MAG: hypothetical protein SGI90_11385 [Candidatus Eisenbacteria bacterium]|nr:hypothetical protein [Candidatus Eisenbacteria bacterium]
MKRNYNRLGFLLTAVAGLALASPAVAAPINGIYNSTDLGGQLLTGRASTWRPGINSGLPHVLHGQSWNGALGTQWDVSCALETTQFGIQDNRISGTGTVVYTSTFQGGTFTLYPGAWPWGDGVGTLGTTILISTVQFVNNIPVASVVNGNTSGTFEGGCALTFAIANGNGIGETTSLNPLITKPADYPTFQDATCGPAPANQQFGTWGEVRTITMMIDCPVPVAPSTWSGVKARF